MRWRPRFPYKTLSLALVLSTIYTGCRPLDTAPAEGAPPSSRRAEVVDVIHGVEIADPYRWLEDQESAETRDWIAAQNAHTLAHLADRPERPALERRLGELLRIDRVAAPIERGGRYFLWKKRATDDLWILYLRRGLGGEDEVLIDPHTLSPDHTTGVSLAGISHDGHLLAYEIRQGGADETEIRVLDVDRREDLPDRLPIANYSGVAWTPDKAGFYYGRQERGVGYRVFHHPLGADPENDPLVFGEDYGPGRWISVDLSQSGRFLLFRVEHGWSRTELFFHDREAGGAVNPLTGDLVASFSPAFAGDRLFVKTDWQAPTGRILEIDLEHPDPSSWREVVPARGDALQGFSLIGGELFTHSLHQVASRLERFRPDGEPLGEVELPGLGSSATPQGSWDSPSAFFSFQSFTVPATIYRFDTVTGDTEVWSRDSVPFAPDGYQTRQVWFQSQDGTEVPMFLVHRRDLPTDAERPTLLYGYGGFNVSLTPRFRPLPALWIESGGVYALANLRGGGEFGDAWHRAGMLEKKQNVFDDFIAAAEWLTENRLTRPEKLAIQGASNGGLLVGAVMTQRPELYRAVLCQFPDLDMVRYYQFENNNPPALLEYGDASDPEQFRFLYAYSPYQNIRDGVAYPAVMLTSGDRDTRVPPLQARKMTARLQAATSSERPVFLLYDTQAGHAGGRPQSKVIEDLSLEAVFLFTQLGLGSD